MTETDTVQLLMECNSGIQMAVYSIDEVLKDVKDSSLKKMLSESKKQHETLGNETHELLSRCGEEPKEPTPMAKGMSWIKTNTKMMFEDSDRAAADLITDGCNMGIKFLYRYLNQYQAADKNAKSLTENLIRTEEDLRHQICNYL